MLMLRVTNWEFQPMLYNQPQQMLRITDWGWTWIDIERGEIRIPNDVIQPILQIKTLLITVDWFY